MAELVFLIYCGCGALAIAGSALAQELRVRRIATAVRGLQELIEAPRYYRHATAEDRELVDSIPSEESDELAHHLTALGDVIVSYSVACFALRVYLDADRTTFVYLHADGAETSINAESYTASEELKTTSSRERVPLPRAPFQRIQSLSSYRGAEQFLRAHRDFLKTASDRFVAFESLDDVIRIWVASHEREMAWRASLPPDEVLDQELRLVLGPAYEYLGETMRRRLRPHVPRAQLRTRERA